jgi:glycerol-3-phosphate dehydrogenase subunit B
MRADVIVVGSGAAGAAAAFAACEAGARVGWVRGGNGATALTGGAWDVATDLDEVDSLALGATETIRESVERVARRRRDHPYARLKLASGDASGVALVEHAHRVVLSRLPSYRPCDWDGPGALIVTELGVVRRTATCQRAVLSLRELDGATIGVLTDPAGTTHPLGHSRLANLIGNTRFVELKLPASTPSTRLVDELGKAVKAGSVDAVLLPPVSWRDDAEERLGVRIFETATGLAGVQAQRLTSELRALVSSERCAVYDRFVIRVDHVAERHVAHLDDGTQIESASLVLATGQRLGGGLGAGAFPSEPLLGLPIYVEGAPVDRASSDAGLDPVRLYGGDGPGYRAGVGYDEHLRALADDGSPYHAGLFAAGSILEGIDARGDGTGLGTCLTTGWVVGQNAAAHAARQ